MISFACLFSGFGVAKTSLIFSFEKDSPSLSMTCPTYSTDWSPILTFSGLSVMLYCSSREKILDKFASNSSSVSAKNTIISSR